MLICSGFINAIPFRGEIRRIPATYSAFLLGVLMRKLNKERIYNKWMLLITGGILLIAMNFGNIELSEAKIVNPLFYCICTVSGWGMLMSISSILIKHVHVLSEKLIYIGKHTMPVLCLHLLGFKLVSLVYILIYNRPMCLLASFHILFETPDFCWIPYTFVGVGIPLILYYVYSKSRLLLKKVITTKK